MPRADATIPARARSGSPCTVAPALVAFALVAPALVAMTADAAPGAGGAAPAKAPASGKVAAKKAAPDPVARACRYESGRYCRKAKDPEARRECLLGDPAIWDLGLDCYRTVTDGAEDDGDWRVICRADIERDCGSARGGLRQMDCLRRHHRRLGSNCVFALYGECDPGTWTPDMRCGGE